MKATREVRLDAGKYGQMAFRKQEDREIRSSGGGGNDPVPLTVARWYGFREPGGYLGNVGFNMLEWAAVPKEEGWRDRFDCI